MFKLQHQFNNIVKTTQLTNDYMPEFYCHCECSKCPLFALSSNVSFQSLNLISLSQPCRSVLVAGSASLTTAIVFSFVLSLQ